MAHLRTAILLIGVISAVVLADIDSTIRVTPPAVMTVQEGSPIQFECTYSPGSERVAKVEWYFYSYLLTERIPIWTANVDQGYNGPEDNRYHGDRLEDSQIGDLQSGHGITIQNAKYTDVGIYYCDVYLESRGYAALAVASLFSVTLDCNTGSCVHGDCEHDGCKCEGGWTGDNCNTVNVAYNKPATQCGTYREAGIDYTASMALDGNRDSYLKQGSCAHPFCHGEKGWWMVDLQAQYIINSVTIANRRNFFNRLRNFVIRGGDSEYVTEHSLVCVRYDATFPMVVDTVECDVPITARYISIQIEHNDRDNYMFALCEVEVVGEIAAPGVCNPDPCTHGNCVDGGNDTYSCECRSHWQGLNCDTPINECNPNPCVHGDCIDLVTTYTCTCEPGWFGTNCNTFNVAYNKPATQCGTYREADIDYSASLAFDGNTDASFYHGSCAHPFCYGQKAWMMVDLQDEYIVSSVTIYNRGTFSYRTRDFSIAGGSTNDITQHSQECAHHVGRISMEHIVTCTSPITARYISMQIDHDKKSYNWMFAVCEMVVVGERAA